jgi:hypothetical protein
MSSGRARLAATGIGSATGVLKDFPMIPVETGIAGALGLLIVLPGTF